MIILDTDHVSLFLRGNTQVVKNVLKTSPKLLSTTIITVEEICQGWLAEINKYTQPSLDLKLVAAYAEFLKATEFFKAINIIGYDQSAHEQFIILRSMLKRLGTKDLRIAAIALSLEAILVTRNVRDFTQISELKIKDWSN
jgi:tRNA(fMet)-specific endonuclease VapC